MNLLNDLTLQQIFTRTIGYLLFAAAHGVLLASFARILGARGPLHDGRLTPNPLSHLSMWGLLMAILFRVGWILPMQIDLGAIRGKRWGVAICAFASLTATLALIPLVNSLRPLIILYAPETAGQFMTLILTQFQNITFASVVLNLLPLPLLTGRLFLIAALPAQQRRIVKAAPLFTGLLVAAMLLWMDTTLAPALLKASGLGR